MLVGSRTELYGRVRNIEDLYFYKNAISTPVLMKCLKGSHFNFGHVFIEFYQCHQNFSGSKLKMRVIYL